MPSWNQVLEEIKTCNRVDALDFVRRKYLKQLHEYRQKRNIICYYSGWLQKPNIMGIEIDDNDKNALMTAIHKLDRSKGLDLILHTPGGQVAATESLVDYLRAMFGTNIHVFIPQIAMSAGTMIACASEKIFMGKQSNLGPIDPQFNQIPASEVIAEFERATAEIKDEPAKIPLWQVIISKYHPTFIGECENAIKWSKEIVTKWLETGMFKDIENPKQKAEKIVKKLSDHSTMYGHSRHLSIKECSTVGLNIEELENDHKLQDLVLTVHHSYMHTFSHSSVFKIIENHKGIATVLHAQVPNKQ